MCIEIGGGWVWAWTDEMKQFLFAWRHFEAVWLWTLIVVFINTIIIALRCVVFCLVLSKIKLEAKPWFTVILSSIIKLLPNALHV